MYFLTEKDPNYTIKGSRDPLGFQVIWQAAGRRLIPHISTVSNSIVDFQIICLAYTIKKEQNIEDKDFEPFFIRFEQMMAYTRFINKSDKERGFNGVDKVRKTMTSTPASIKISTEEQILSNQKAYGIWGKYNRPFTDMHITKHNSFDSIYSEKLKSNTGLSKQVKAILKSNESRLKSDLVETFAPLLEKPILEEKELFTKTVLQDTCNQELLAIFNKNEDWKGLSFYELVDYLTKNSSNEKFKAILKYIVQNEKTISPLNRIFRYLQTKSYWKNEEIEQDVFISSCRNDIDTTGFDDTLSLLALLHKATNLDLVKGIIKRNETICNSRNSSPWMELTEKGVDVNHFEGALYNEEYQPDVNNDNTYFLWSFVALYNQLN